MSVVPCDYYWCLSLVLSVTRDSSQQLSVSSLPGGHRSQTFLPEILQQHLLRVTTGSVQQPLMATICGMVLYKCTSKGTSSNCFALAFRETDLWVTSCFSSHRAFGKFSMLTILDVWNGIWHIYKLPIDHTFSKFVNLLYGQSI